MKDGQKRLRRPQMYKGQKIGFGNFCEGDIIESIKIPTARYLIIWNEFGCCFSVVNREEVKLINSGDDLLKYNVLINKSNININWLKEYQFQTVAKYYENPEKL
jgi:hypothetical protein